MKTGDLVRYNYEGKNSDNSLIGIVMSDHYKAGNDKIYNSHRDIWWMCKDRISPVDIEYLEVVNDNR